MSEEIELNPNEQRKKKQLTIVIISAIALVLIIVGSLFFMGEEPGSSPQTVEQTVDLTPPGGTDDEAAWRATAQQDIVATRDSVGELKTQLVAKDGEVTSLKGEITEINNRLRQAEINADRQSRTPAQPTNTTPPSVNGNGSSAFGVNIPNRQGLHGSTILSDPMGSGVDPATGQIIPLPNNQNNAAVVRPKQLNIIDLTTGDSNQGNVAVSQNKKAGQNTFISDGSFVRVVMVTGVDAPTGGQSQEDPLPVLFETVGKLDMPNNYKMNIKGCRFLGYAWGSLSTERVNARIESGSCIINGKAVSINVKGQVFGEDGKPGVRGKVVSKQGQALSAAALSSALEAIGGLYGNTTGTTSMGALGVQRTVSGKDVRESAIGGGVSGATEKLSEFYLRRAEELFPIVEVHAGRAVEILITKGAVVEGLSIQGAIATKRKLKDD